MSVKPYPQCFKVMLQQHYLVGYFSKGLISARAGLELQLTVAWEAPMKL